MRHPVRSLCMAALISPLAVVHAPAESTPVQSQIESVGLFKNGLFVVRETIKVPGSGTYSLDTVPKAIHGTLWFESESLFEARVVQREEVRPASSPRDMAQAGRQLEGQRVILSLAGGEKLEGTILSSHDSSQVRPLPVPSPFHFEPPPVVGGSTIAVETPGGVAFVPASSVQWINVVDGGAAKALAETVTIPTLELVVGETSAHDTAITMTYLSNGMAWAPSYQIDFDEAGSATIGVSTIIRNEWRDLAGTRVDLISGFPQIEHSAVTSLLWHETTLASFFGQLNMPASSRSSGVASQMIVMNTVRPVQSSLPDLSNNMAGAGEDLYFYDLGPLNLARNSAVGRRLASATTPAARFVDWRIGDDRDMHGRSEVRESTNDAWDSLRFTNPFDFPLTTAPASVWMDGRFRGQSTATFTNPGAEAVVKVTKALSVETRHEEFDMERGDPRVILRDNYQPVTVRSEMTVINRRKTAATIEITREFQGTRLSASDEPARLRTVSKRNAINPFNEARWVLEIPAGEEKIVTLDYEVLVRM